MTKFLAICIKTYKCLFRSRLLVSACLQSRSLQKPGRQSNSTPVEKLRFNLLKTQSNRLYIRNQFVPRSKHFPPRL